MLWLGGGLFKSNPLRTVVSRFVVIGQHQQHQSWKAAASYSVLSKPSWNKTLGGNNGSSLPFATQLQLPAAFPCLQSLVSVRTFALTKKDQLKRKAALRKIKVQGAPKPKPKPAISEQMKTWATFQRAIAVQGYDTGQMTEAKRVQRNRGGRAARKRKQRDLTKREATVAKRRVVVAGGGRYPATRLSEADTAALLAKAYAGIPARTGKRGTRNLKRQKRRWFLVRKIHAKIKRFRILAHFRRMAKRSSDVKSVLAVKEIAPDIQLRDRAYQEQILQRWADTMTKGMGEDDEGVEEGEVIPEGELIRS